MSVKYEHPEYVRLKNKWARCRAASAGQDAVHEAGDVFLPRLSNQTDEQYNSYKSRAGWYNATWRTIDGLRGMIFRKPVMVEANETAKKMMDDVTLTGQSLHMFGMDAVEEVLTVGRVGIFTDYPNVPPNMTLADARLNNYRPMLKMYKAESIINWKSRVINGVNKLAMVVLVEEAPVPDDEFQDSWATQYRVLDLMQSMTDTRWYFRVRVIIIEKDTETGKEVEKTLSTEFPKAQGQFLQEIPFQFIGTDSVTPEADTPPLIDLVDVNFRHYQVTADYEHGCHFTGLPTPWVTGFMQEGDNKQSFNIGSSEAWTFSSHNAKVGYLEFTGQGLQALEKNLARKENQMAVLGARMLEAQRTTTESANTATIRQGGEQSMLASIVNTVTVGFNKSLKWFALFGSLESITAKFNKDFFPFPMDSLMMTAIVASWQNSAISYDTMYENLQRGEIIKLDRTADEEQALIKANPPPLPAGKMENASPNLAQGGKADDKTSTEMQAGKV